MNGMQMMLKSIGIEPDVIQAQLTQAKDAIETKVATVDEKLSAILNAQTQNTEILSAIGCALIRLEMKFNTLPKEEAEKLLAANAPTVEELEQIYGRGNNGNDNNGNRNDANTGE